MKRIVHVLAAMHRGGVETWLMHVLRHIDCEQFHMDFIVHTTETWSYDDEIIALGSKLIPCMSPAQPFRYARKLEQILQEGQYDIIHSHVHHYSGWILRVGKQAKIPIRIAHSHNDTSKIQQSASISRKMYYAGMRQFINMYATHIVGASRKASQALFKEQALYDARHQLLYYGIDLNPFESPAKNCELRQELGIPEDAFVIGHVGRFEEQKNHSFLIEVFREIHKRNPSAYCVLIGEGSLRQEIESQVLEYGLADSVLFTGIRGDIPQMMLDVMDCFLFPSFYEGLGIVLLEAQAAGIPCVYSDTIPEDVVAVPELMQAFSLNYSASKWAENVIQYDVQDKGVSQSQALLSMQDSHFNIDNSVVRLQAIYEQNS